MDIIEMIASLRKFIDLNDYITSLKKFNSAFDLMEKRQWKKAIVGYKEGMVINSTISPAFGNVALCYAHLNENKSYRGTHRMNQKLLIKKY